MSERMSGVEVNVTRRGLNSDPLKISLLSLEIKLWRLCLE